MIFWRKKNNAGDQDREADDDRLIHRPTEPPLEPPVEYDAEISPEQKHEFAETETEVIDTLSITPVPELAHETVSHTDDGGWLSALKAGLSRTTAKLSDGVSGLVGKTGIDADSLQDLEDVLISADVGPTAAQEIAAELAAKAKAAPEMDGEGAKLALIDIIESRLEQAAIPLNIQKPAKGPRVFLICGVNGVGKTTTIGKLAYQMHFNMGRKVMLAAGDTFRAAALEQLQIWAERVGAKLIKRDLGSDPAALAYEAYEAALAEGADVLMIDTAGRLHNKQNLMAELEKIVRVLRKHDPDLPHEVLLVLDSTTGQNALSQVETFRDIVNVTGLVVTKLDGSARGGILLALVEQFGLPVFAIGVGEQIDDLQPFRARAFAEALVS
jgi:fused signal recognition particle receptor